CIIDRTSLTMRVEGRGGVHIRAGGHEVLVLTSGSTTALADVEAAAHGRQPDLGAPGGVARGAGAGRGPAAPRVDAMAEELAALKDRFDRALVAQDASAATAAALDTEQLIRDWSADTEQGGASEAAVAQLRAMITRLGDLAGAGMHDHTELVRPHIETLLHVREDARTRRAFEVADHIREHMDADGVRVNDTREGTDWEWDDPNR
ncbi:MAG TPA: hypothetical protein VMM13_01095, partial [Euzebya sp.]|nr:hypothetical protein [Euzebya sp.]